MNTRSRFPDGISIFIESSFRTWSCHENSGPVGQFRSKNAAFTAFTSIVTARLSAFLCPHLVDEFDRDLLHSATSSTTDQARRVYSRLCDHRRIAGISAFG